MVNKLTHYILDWIMMLLWWFLMALAYCNITCTRYCVTHTKQPTTSNTSTTAEEEDDLVCFVGAHQPNHTLSHVITE